jgi:hypothetical protein
MTRPTPYDPWHNGSAKMLAAGNRPSAQLPGRCSQEALRVIEASLPTFVMAAGCSDFTDPARVAIQ